MRVPMLVLVKPVTFQWLNIFILTFFYFRYFLVVFPFEVQKDDALFNYAEPIDFLIEPAYPLFYNRVIALFLEVWHKLFPFPQVLALFFQVADGGIQRHPVHPGAPFGIAAKGIKGSPKLVDDLLVQVPTVFLLVTIQSGNLVDYSLVLLDLLYEILLSAHLFFSACIFSFLFNQTVQKAHLEGRGDNNYIEYRHGGFIFFQQIGNQEDHSGPNERVE